jgi:F-type H+-transporting ATPase subunit gamma
MANQKEIRTRIGTVKNTQKITRAMKMVAGARLHRAQSRIQAMRPYALETERVLGSVVRSSAEALGNEGFGEAPGHPFLERREEKRVALLVVTSDRGLCGAFNSNILRRAEAFRAELAAQGKEVELYIVGRKARDFFARRHVPVREYFSGLWEKLSLEAARRVARSLLKPFFDQEVDAIYLVFSEFKSAMTQIVRTQGLLPVAPPKATADSEAIDYLFEPSRDQLLEVLVPMYIEVTILRALYESTASELGARMTAMDSATKNATDMIAQLTLEYNRARQAAITTELMEIIGGSEALNG